ncbi:hypothetical protein HY227_01045 [Candidatus Wolfebacteria bacterium]|nr:hypothetical protein [Candidatus Wolfebacteria bacterium]
MKKIILWGIIAGVIMLFIGLAIDSLAKVLFPLIRAEYENPGLFRPWSDPLMSLYFLYPFLVGIILAWVWTKVKGIFDLSGAWNAGIRFGLIYWLVSIPGMLISYASFPLSLTMVLIWTIGGLLQSLVAGVLFAKYL